MKTPEDILKEALGEIRYKLNGTVTNAQLKWAMEEYAKLYHESKVKKISLNVPVMGSVCLCSETHRDSTYPDLCARCGDPLPFEKGKHLP